MSPFDENLVGNDKKASSLFNCEKYIDIHCHCLAGVDDGPSTIKSSIQICQALLDDNISTVIATPHQLGRYSGFNSATEIRKKVCDLNGILKNEGINLEVKPGADVRVDERICRLLEKDEILTLSDNGKYILLELPHEIFIDIEVLLEQLLCRGIYVILSHPERHPAFYNYEKKLESPLFEPNQIEALRRWQKYSINFQITAGSLLGRFGSKAQQSAWYFLDNGLAGLVATDSHDFYKRRPCMRDAFEQIKSRFGQQVARLLCIENPMRALEGKDLIPTDVYTRKCVNETISNTYR